MITGQKNPKQKKKREEFNSGTERLITSSNNPMIMIIIHQFSYSAAARTNKEANVTAATFSASSQ